MNMNGLKQQKHHIRLNLILVIALAAMLLPALSGALNTVSVIPDGDAAGPYAAIVSANNSDHMTLNDLTVTCGSATNGGICKTGKVTLVPIPVSAVHHSWQLPRIRNTNGTSSNWSGYAVYPDPPSSPGKKNGKKFTSTQTFSDVAGSWVVPSVGSSTSTNTYSAVWLGLDGYSDNTVEQIGTEQD
jgi:hypothetical protein